MPGLQRDFNAGLQPGELIEVKAPFKTPDGGNEWMWVEISSWKGNLIRGVLKNEPFNIPDLHSGQVVEIWQGDVFDYIREYPDKRREGNTTGDILEKMRQKANPDSDHATGTSTKANPRQANPNCFPN